MPFDQISSMFIVVISNSLTIAPRMAVNIAFKL